MLRNRSVMAADCALEAQKDVATRAEAIIVAIAARPGVAATPPLKARIGGLSGLSIDLGVDQSAGTTCAGDDGGFVPLFGAMESYGWGYAGVGSHERMRLIALDVADNENLVILVTAPDAAAFERHIGAAEAIVKHLAFKVGLAA